MYHHHQQQQQQQQGPQAFSSGPRPPLNQPQNRPPADMMSSPGPYQFPRPTQLPDELESALSVRGSRDMDHRLIEHLDRLKQHQSQVGMSQHGNYGANLCDTQPNQSVDWSNYEPPTKLYRQQSGGQHPSGQHPSGQHPGTGLPNWNPQSEGGRGFYTPESAGTILASFGLSNEDLEALSHYPDDQLTPDTLPFILRDLQVHKKPKSSHSPEVPSLLTVTQTEGRVIDYGHASQAKDESGPPKTYKKEPISSERTVKMYPSPVPKLEGRQVRMEPSDSTKHGDKDYRRRSSEHHSSRSPPPRDFSTSAKQRHQDRDYRLEQPKPRVSAEKRSAELSVSKPHPPPNMKPLRSGLKSSGNKKLPTPTMMSDFSGVLPKVYPHTCSLCNMECDQEQEWIGHLETVNHTAACRHLRTKYPNWKPKLLSRDHGKRPATPHSASRSTSWSPPPPLPPFDKHRGTSYKLRGKPYHHVARHHPYHTKDVDGRYERPHARGGATLRRPAFRDDLEKKELASAARAYLKRPYFESKRGPSFKSDLTKKTPPGKAKSNLKPGQGTKQVQQTPPAKKKKPGQPSAAHGPECLVYLTDIPKEATEQEVINLAGSFGPINNVLLMPPHDEEEDKSGQQASVCMTKPKDALTFATSPNLLIRDRVITATVAKKPEEQSSDADGSVKLEQQDAGGDQISENKKGLVLIKSLPESGWTEEDLKALAEPFGYPDDIIVAKQIKKALYIMPDIETAQEMVKVLTFSPPSINEQTVTVRNVYRNIGIHTPVALYNLLMYSIDGAVSLGKGSVGWGTLIVVSNVPQTPSSASIVHKLVSRIGTVCKTLAVNNLVICEMATGPLATAVYRHYLRFPCMIQNSPLVFSRKPDPKTPVKVIPAFLDTDNDVPEQKAVLTDPTVPLPSESVQTETSANPEAPEEIVTVEVKCEEAEEAVVAEKESPEENPTTTTVKDEPVEMKCEDVVKADEEEAVKTEPAETDQTSTEAPKENGAEVQTADEPTIAASAEPTEGEAAPNTAGDAQPATAVAAEKESPATAPKPSTPSAPKRTSQEKSKDWGKNSHRSSISSGREDERRRADKDWRERESRDRERRERDWSRKDRDHDERSKRDYERERRWDPRRDDPRRDDPRRDDPRRDDARRDDARREEQKRAWRREWERREGKRRPYLDPEPRRSDDSKRLHQRDDRQKSFSEGKTEDEEFPFDLSDFVTVDEVGDIDLDIEFPETEPGSDPGLELGSDSQTEQGSDQKPAPEMGPETQTERPESGSLPQETQEKVEDISMEIAEEPGKTEVKPEEQAAEETKETTVQEDEEAQTAEGGVAEITEQPCPDAAEEKCETNQEEPPEPLQDTPEVIITTPEEELKEEVSATQKDEGQQTTSAPSAEPEQSENGEKDSAQNAPSDENLPPFNASSSVGLEYLVPMSGFFCKVCTRFFTGAKDAQLGHSKTFKHYENLQKFLKTSSSTDAGKT